MYVSSKSRSRSQSTIFALTLFDGKCQNLQKTSTHFCANCYHFRYIIFLFKKVDQDHGVQISHWYHSMANITIYKRLSHIFVLALTVSDILIFLNFDLQKLGQCHILQFLHWHCSMENIKIYRRLHTFLRSLLPFQRY